MKNTTIFTLLLITLCTFVRAQSMQSFGKKISADGANKPTYVYEALKSKETAQVKVKGRILKVCKRKGCWMTMDLGNQNKMLIRFKDYGFFVPKDCNGKVAIVEGTAKKEVISVATLRHYAKDAGKSEKEIKSITKPKEKITFEAVGVLLESSK